MAVVLWLPVHELCLAWDSLADVFILLALFSILFHPQFSRLVVSFADIAGIRDKLPAMSQQLEVCQRALSDFLEDKRAAFPR